MCLLRRQSLESRLAAQRSVMPAAAGQTDEMTTTASEATTPSGPPVLPRLPEVLLGSALVTPYVIAGVYRGIGRDAPDVLPFLNTFLIFCGVAAWFRSYCRALRVSLPMDMGWALILAWPVVVPYFILKREGRRGLRRLGLFIVAWLAAALVGVATSLITSVVVGSGE